MATDQTDQTDRGPAGDGPVLVTGATGYIGGLLVPELLRRGRTVRVLSRSADRIAEQTLPAVSLLVPAAGRIRVRPEVPEKMRRALGPAPYQWVGTFPRPVPSGLPATGTLRRGIDEVELPVVPDAPWILATVLPDGASVHEHLAPASPLVARLRVPEVPVAGPVTLPVRAALPWDPAVLVALAAMVV